MLRLLFSKTGDAVWISHLDTMRLFQRAFKRAGFHLKHTQGFNPRPSVSIAMPLSVGVESCCELLDFELEDQDVSCQLILERLNASLVSGIRVQQVYENGQKLKYLKYLQCHISMEYDAGVPDCAPEDLEAFFKKSEIVAEKKGKNGITEQNIAPMIRNIAIRKLDDGILGLDAVISCQEPNLNPVQLIAAVTKYLPQYQPDFSKCCRQELFAADGNIFR